MAGSKKILFLTNSEYGQANVVLAVAHELVSHHQADIHIASFPALEPRVTALKESLATSSTAHEGSVTFTALAGKSMAQCIHFSSIVHSPGIKGAIEVYRVFPTSIASWDGPEYLDIVRNCKDIIGTVEPDMIVVDNIFSPGVDAALWMKRKYVVLSPNTLKELGPGAQPGLGNFCKYPAPCSGFPFPLPLSLVPANLYLNIRLIYILIRSPRLWAINSDRKAAGLEHQYPLFDPYRPEVHYILMSAAGTEFPYPIADNISACGPIMLASPPVADTDPELSLWLKRAPTILVCLGSHVESDVKYTREIASGLRTILDRRPDVQVLWKIKRGGFSDAEDGDVFSSTLSKEISSDRVRIESWLKVDPLAILESGQVVCFVNHGGSNSYHEAVFTGVPQIVLPKWIDCYDFARRAEWLKIGIYGNESCAPDVEAAELGRALTAVVDGPSADEYRRRAKEVGEISRRGGGRAAAAAKILEQIS